MSIEIVTFVFGGLLLLVGVVGGGVEIRELKIPKVGVLVRVVAVVAGLVFICLGIGLADGKNTVEGPKGPVDFTLTDELGEGEISEQVTLLVDGKNVGNLTVNRDYPNSSMTVTVSGPGQHSYTAEATAVFDDQGQSVEFTGVGQGMINVERGRTYSLRGSISGSNWLVSIMEER